MEFNEVNKNAVTNFLAQLNKNNLSNAKAGEGFADLLAKSDDASEVKTSSVSANERNHKLDSSANDVKGKDRYKDKRDVKSADAPKAEKMPTKKENKPVEAREDLSVPTEVKDTASPKEVVTADVATDVATDVVADESGVVSSDTTVSQPVVEVEEKLTDFAIPMVSVIPVENKNTTTVLPLEAMEAVANPEEKVVLEPVVVTQQAQVAAPKVSQKVDAVADVFDEKGELVSKTVADQSSEIAELLGDDAKVKIEVTTKEENFAHRSSKDLLANAKLVDDIAEGGAKIEVTTATSVNSPAPSNNQNQVPVTPVANAAPVVAPVVDAVEVAALPVKEASSVTLSQAGTPGSEFVQAAKLEAANDSKATSFKDVYKGLSRETIDQIKVNITKSAVQGIDKIQIQLKPEDLGNIEVKLQIGKDGKLQAHIISSRPETMEALQKEMGNLEKAFNDAGFQTDEGSLSFSFREDSHANQNQERDSGLRNFIGDIFEKEANQELVSGETYNADYSSINGLNIRV